MVASAAGAVGECLLAQRQFAAAEPFIVDAFATLLSAKGKTDQRTRDLGASLIALYDVTNRRDNSDTVRAQLR